MKLTRNRLDFGDVYAGFGAPVVPIDCGRICAPHNPSGKPFCCDICCAVPVAYQAEWKYLRQHTSLWHAWRGDECEREPGNRAELEQQTPAHLRLMACAGPDHCERDFRAVSCRQFPFFPYITPDFRFIGMTYDWEFRGTCWVISHLDQVTADYRREFFNTYDRIFETWLEDFDSYVELSEEVRAHYMFKRKRIPLLHRNGCDYLVSPASGGMRKAAAGSFPRFLPYTTSAAAP